MSRAGELTVGDIAAMLNARAESLAPMLLREGVKDGKHFRAGSVAGERGQSLALNLAGPRKGMWTDFSAAQGAPDHSGDMLHLVAMSLYGGRSKEQLADAIKWAKHWLGLDNASPRRVDEIRREADRRAREAEQQAARDDEQKRKWAYGLWASAVAVTDTPAATYLKTRGLGALPKAPGSLRFHPQAWCPVRRAKYPAMVACIMGLDGQLLGAHRTYLDVSAGKGGPVRVVKVVADPATKTVRVAEAGEPRAKSHKLSIGNYQGGCIPLWKGSCPKTLRDIAEGTPVYISEGIEDGLSVAAASPDRRVVAAVAIANMGGLQLPPQAGPVVLVGQNDPIDSKAVDAFERAIARQQEAGRKVQAMFPPADVKDFNELLMREIAA